MYLRLRNKIQEMLKSKSTLLWLEGSHYEQVQHVQMKGQKLVLSLGNGTIQLVKFDKYTFTAVGIQFWNQARPGVLYRWDMPIYDLPNATQIMSEQTISTIFVPDDDPTPPDAAA